MASKNIKFSYLYRDGSNYKNFNEIVFSNIGDLVIEGIEASIRKKLIDGRWFYAAAWKVPDMHFREYAWDSEVDHEWHEFKSIEETLEPATTEYNIEDFLLIVNKTELPW